MAARLTFLNILRNKFCFTGGYIESSVQLPGANNVLGFWPAIWTLGNLGRAGYGASLEGLVNIFAGTSSYFEFISTSSGLTRTMPAMLVQRLTRLSTDCQLQRRRMVTPFTTDGFHFYQVNAFLDAHATARAILDQFMPIGHTWGGPPLKLTSSKPR